MAKTTAIQIGDRVGLSAKFLRSTGQFTGKAPARRGEVIDLEDMGSGLQLAEIRWDDGDASRVLNANLARVGTKEMSAN